METVIIAGQDYVDKTYSSFFLNALDRIRCSTDLSDITLRCHDTDFKAHKVVLAAASNYFYAMFTGGLKESNVSLVELREIDPSALAVLLKYTYSGIININGSNVQSILEAADLLHFESAIDLCIDFMIYNLDVQNCMQVFQLAEKHSKWKLKTCAKQFIDKNFSEISMLDSFKDVDLKLLLEVSSSDNLMVLCESEVLQGIVRWLIHQDNDKLNVINDLISVVRLHYIGPRPFAELFKKLNYSEPHILIPRLENLIRARLRSSMSILPMRKTYESWLYVIGGEKSFLKELRIIECYDNSTNTWKQCEPLRNPKSSFAAVYFKGKLYIVAGMKASLRLKSVECFDPETGSWSTHSHLAKCTGHVSAVVHDGNLYAAGGSTDRVPVCRHVEKFDNVTKTWCVTGKMVSRRRKFCLISCDGSLYALGGLDDRKGALRSVERYCSSTTGWNTVSPLSTSRYDFGAAVLSGYIYAVGGANGTMGSLNLVEKYDPETDTWTSCSPMNNCRGGLSMAVYFGRILAISGINSYMSVVDSIESYDEIQDKWFVLNNSCTGRANSAAVTLPLHFP